MVALRFVEQVERAGEVAPRLLELSLYTAQTIAPIR